MPRAPSEKVKEAEKLYRSGMKLVEIASQLGVPDGTVRRWKSTYCWNNKSERSKRKSERSKQIPMSVNEVMTNAELNDKQQLFCLLFCKSFNATKSYQKAYGCSYDTALVSGPRLMGNARVKAEIQKLKQERYTREFLSEEDIFQKYMDIAFADISDYLEWEQEEVPVTVGEDIVVKTISNVKFKDNIDGTLISEVKLGKRFKVKDEQPGVNAPPMHPWCRSTTICDISDEELAQMKRRSKNPATGKSELVPANMTYEEWHKKFVDGNPEAELNEKMERNKSRDKKQYAKYIKELDSYVPSNFKDFQRIKYTNKQEYGIIKTQYKGMGYYNKALTNEPEITKHIKAVAENTKLDIQGLENRIKTKDSYLIKIRSNYEQGKTEYEIKDIVRYTYTSKPEDIVGKTQKAIDIGSKQGYNTIEVKNYWLDKNNPYNGINTTVQASNGQKFEVQYHTDESYKIKEKMHKDYEKWRLMDKSSYEAKELRKNMFKQSADMKEPYKIEEVR